jgi:subtilisin family serine protease
MVVEMKELLVDYDPLIWNEMLFSSSVINDPIYSDSEKGWYFEAIHFDPAFLELGDEEIQIAFVDDGFDISHEDFSSKAAQGFDFYHHQPGVYGKMTGTNESGQPIGNIHGTHVIGISSAQQNNGKGSLGLSPNCKVIPLQVSDEWSELWPSSVIIDAILFSMNNGANVINLSLGLPMTKVQWLSMSSTEQNQFIENSSEQASFWNELYAYGEELGVVFVKAAGNSSIPVEFDPMCRSNLPIYVMATDRQSQLAEFSNLIDDKLNYTSIAAPGVDIFSAIPGNSYHALNGTSMSAPMVSSLVALMFSKDAKMSPQDIREILQAEPKTVLSNDIHAPLLNFKSVLEKIDNQS